MSCFSYRFLIVFGLCCFNLRQSFAQSPAQPAPSQPVQVQVPTFDPKSTSGGSLNGQIPTGAVTKPASATTGKYYEYSSYCQAPLEFKKRLSASEIDLEIKNLNSAFEKNRSFIHFEKVFNFLIQENEIKKAKDFLAAHKSLLSLTQDKIITARLFSAEKKYRDAIAALDSVDESAKNNLQVLIEYSKAYRKLNNFFEAKSALQDAMKLDLKNKRNYLLDLCILETEDSSHSEVDVVCPQVGKAFPNDHIHLIYLGISYRERLDYKQAQKLFEKSAQKEKNEFALTCLGEVFYLQKNYSKALEAFQAAIATEPRSGRAQLGSAQSLYQMLRFSEALPYYAKACELDKNTTLQFRQAQQPLETSKADISSAYFQEIQKCMQR